MWPRSYTFQPHNLVPIFESHEYHAKRPMDKKLLIASERHERIFKFLVREYSILATLIILIMLSLTWLVRHLQIERESILRFGLKHNQTTDQRQWSQPLNLSGNNLTNITYFLSISLNSRKWKRTPSNRLDYDDKN